MRSLHRHVGLWVCGCAIVASSALHAAPAQGLADLLGRLPEPPTTAEEATRWIDKSGALQHAGLIALKAEVETHRRATQAILQAAVPAQQSQAAMQQADLAKGMANVGIDMQRMQSDPAYAQTMQARMKSMTPE